MSIAPMPTLDCRLRRNDRIGGGMSELVRLSAPKGTLTGDKPQRYKSSSY